MESGTNLRVLIEANKENITSAIKKESINKEYFQGIPLPPEQFLNVLITDYLETIIVCRETGSMTIFLEKLNWFKEMYNSRQQDKISADQVLDFFHTLKSQLTHYCQYTEPALEDLFVQMEESINEIFKGDD